MGVLISPLPAAGPGRPGAFRRRVAGWPADVPGAAATRSYDRVLHLRRGYPAGRRRPARAATGEDRVAARPGGWRPWCWSRSCVRSACPVDQSSDQSCEGPEKQQLKRGGGRRLYQSARAEPAVKRNIKIIELNKTCSVGSYSGKYKEEIPMRLRTTLIQASAAGLIMSPMLALAAEQPISNLGLIGAYNEYEFNSDNDRIDGRDDVGKVGIFYNYGNKMTGGPGVIFQIGANGRYGESGDDEIKDARADLDLGMRMPLNNNSNFDVLVGVGYDWTRFEMDDRSVGDVELSNKSPFAKAAVGWHHRGNNVVTRLEVGTRYSIEGEAKIKLDGVGSETVDLDEKFNPYAELNFLWDSGFTAGLYYTQTNYELKNRQDLAQNTELESNEFGITLGMAF